MAELTREIWEHKFLADAEADNLAIFRDHLRSLGLEGKTTAESMLQGTIFVVDACCTYALLDKQSAAPFLAAQTYDPGRSAAWTYALTFDIWGEACARLLFGADLTIPGLAKLFDHPWYRYEVSGHSGVLISRDDDQYDQYSQHSQYTIDGEIGERSWLRKFVNAELFFHYGKGVIKDCRSRDKAIGGFYVSMRKG